MPTTTSSHVLQGSAAISRPQPMPGTHARAEAPPCSVWSGFQWAMIGNVVYALSQFGILVVLAQVGSPRHVGQYALALAISGPVVLFSNLQLRAILASDAGRTHPFSEYWKLRLVTAPLACAVVALIALGGSFGAGTALVILVAATAKSIETFSDLCYGACQRNQRLDLVGKSLVIKGVGSVLALGALTWATQSVAVGVAGMAAVWLGLLFGYDLPHVRHGDADCDRPTRFGFQQGWTIQRQLIALGLPLGISISLLSLSVALPSILVERYLGEREAGIFAAFSGLAWAGIPLINALGQTAMPKLGEFYFARDRRGLRSGVLLLATLGASLGIAGWVAALVAGDWVVALVYGPEYAAHTEVLMWLLAAAAALFAARFVGDALTAMRSCKIQLTSQGLVALVVLVGGCAVLPHAGLTGMAQVLAAAFALRAIVLAVCFTLETAKIQPSRPVLPNGDQNAIVRPAATPSVRPRGAAPMESEHYFVACPGVLGIRTNLPHFSWSYGATMPSTSRREFEACEIRLRLVVTNDLELPDLASLGKYHYWYGAPGGDALYYDRAFCLGTRLQLAAQGLLGNEPTLRVNRTYYRAVSHRFMNLHSVGYILTDLASLLLLRRGYAPLHCSAFKLGEATIVVAAAPNTGKTLTTMATCIEREAEYLAEDLAITDGTDLCAVPWTSTFRYYRQLDQSLATRLRERATRVLPVVELLKGRMPTPITEYVAADRIVPRSPVTHVVLLERGIEEVRRVDCDEALRRLRNLNRYEFNYHKAPLVVAYEYFHPELDIDEACRSEERILRRLVHAAQHKWIVRTDDPTRYSSLIVDALQNEAAATQSLCAVA